MQDDAQKAAARAEGAELARRHVRVGLACGVFVACMVGAAYAAVPLYDWFCRTTGFGGTPLIATAAPSKTLDRTITVTFDANVDPALAWRFGPEQRAVEVKIGETKLIHYAATNEWSEATVGTASYNVSPPQAAAYFNKMQCFCFTEQRLAAGEHVDMPVAFFIDPAIADDPELKNLNEITLSYTFFPSKKAGGQKSADLTRTTR
ncbi:MAG TPA: cytochrome c oxidase assembly protein [Xanthobacteraceae bacterium]|nr:cytochrome c oxidase assembly protein [Xanthobacteraceae bacterium]